MSQNAKNTKQKTEKIIPAVQLRQLVQYIRTHATPKTLAAYGAVGLTALFIMLGVKLSYTITGQRYYPFMLSYASVCYSVLASVMMLGYIRHSRRFQITYPVLSWMLAVSYGLSGFFVTQENAWTTCVIGVLLPLLMMTLEDVIDGSRYLPFVILTGVLLSIDSLIMIPVLILLFLYAIAEQGGQGRLTLGCFVTYLGTFLFGTLLGSWRIFFQYIPRWLEHDSYAYPGFSSYYGASSFLGRILTGGTSAYTFLGTTQKLDLYLCLPVLLGVTLYLWDSRISPRERIAHVLNLIVSVLFIITTAGDYILHLFTYESTVTLGCGAVLLLLLLRMSLQAYADFSDLPRSAWIKGGLSMLAILAGAWSFGAHNFHAYAGTLCIAGLLCSMGCLYGLNRKKKLFGIALFLCVVAELAGQSWISTNGNHALKTAQKEQTLAKDYGRLFIGKDIFRPAGDHQKVQDTEETNTLAETYSDYLEQHRATEEEETFSELFNTVNMTEKELTKAVGHPFANTFEQINAYADQLGVEEPVFHKETAKLRFVGEEADRVTDLGHQIYALDYMDGNDYAQGSLLTYELKTSGKDIYVLSDADNILIRMDGGQKKTTGYLYFPTVTQIVYNIDFLTYSMNDKAYQQLTKKLQEASAVQKQKSYLSYDYIGMGLTYLGLMLLVLFGLYDKREQVIRKAHRVPQWLMERRSLSGAGHWIYQNRVYLAAFFIPFVVWMITLLVTNCAPFGSNCILDSDGTALTIPTLIDNWFQNRYTGNQYLSMNLGYGFNLGIYYTYHLLGKLYALLPYGAIVGALSVQIALSMGCIGWSMAYYMCHRRMHPAAKADDWFVLAPVFVYTFCSYMLAMRIYPTWLMVYALFPLILVQMDKMMLEKKWFGYTLLLGACIFLEIQLSLYVCIYLFIRFFTYKFAGIKDFFKKGVKFGGLSIVAAGCGFFSIARTLQAYQTSIYRTLDSTFKGFGFFHNFFYQWKDFFPFSNVQAVNPDDGAVLGYLGITTIILAVLFVEKKSVSWKEKLRYFLPILFLLFSFNEKGLAFLWDGFHYQALVPNRFYFLFAFLMAEIGFDSLKRKPEKNKWKISIAACGIWGSIILIQGLQPDVGSWMAFGGACVCFMAVLVCMLIRSPMAKQGIIFVMVIELMCNFGYTIREYSQDSLRAEYGGLEQNKKGFDLLDNNPWERTIDLGGWDTQRNLGEYYNLHGVRAFNSYVDSYQMNTNRQNGFAYGGNSITTNFISTPDLLSKAGVRYVLLPIVSKDIMRGMEWYTFIGKNQQFYVFENKRAYSIGYYQSDEEIKKNHVVSDEDDLYFANLLDDSYWSVFWLGKEGDNLFEIKDLAGKQIDDSELLTILNADTLDTENINMDINFKANETGTAYLYLDQMICIGKVEKGKTKKLTLRYPDNTVRLRKVLYVYICDDEKMNKEMNLASREEMNNIEMSEDQIEGSVNYSREGYTKFNLAYSKNWKAYIDGKQTDTLCYGKGNLYVRTPKGRHRITLKYEPYHYKLYQAISGAFFGVVILVRLLQVAVGYCYSRRRKSGELG